LDDWHSGLNERVKNADYQEKLKSAFVIVRDVKRKRVSSLPASVSLLSKI